MKHTIEFVASGRGKARCAPDPAYPNGKAVDGGFAVACLVELPYPAPECGVFHISCADCVSTLIVTAAGRSDDPVSVTMPCMPPLVQAPAEKGTGS